jgi:hypothetical protein
MSKIWFAVQTFAAGAYVLCKINEKMEEIKNVELPADKKCLILH